MNNVGVTQDHGNVTNSVTPLQHGRDGRFVTGGKPGPGRPKGSRNKLAENFVADAYASWQQNGSAALERLYQEDVAAYVKVMAGLLPKDVNIRTGTLDELSDAQLLRKLAVLSEMAAPLLARAAAVDVDVIEDKSAGLDPQQDPSASGVTITP